MSVAFVFPGQGSQSVGMLRGFEDLPIVVETVQEASEALGEDLLSLMRDGPSDALALTANTQPVMLAADVAIYRAWLAMGGAVPDFMAGHSLGEYAALVCSGALDLSDATRLVRIRARAMQNAVAVGEGAMAAIVGLDAHRVDEACQQAAAAGQVQVANYNEPLQTVISGQAQAVATAGEIAKSMGAKRVLPLPVSAPFHSALMQPAALTLASALAEIVIREPSVSVVNNDDVSIETQADSIKDALVRQAAGAVRWVETVQLMRDKGVSTVIECGPGKVLTGLTRRIDKSLTGVQWNDASAMRAYIEAISS